MLFLLAMLYTMHSVGIFYVVTHVRIGQLGLDHDLRSLHNVPAARKFTCSL